MTTKNGSYLSLSDVAERSGISRTTLYAHIARGNLKIQKVGFFTVVHEDDAKAFMKRLTRINLGSREITVYQPEPV